MEWKKKAFATLDDAVKISIVEQYNIDNQLEDTGDLTYQDFLDSLPDLYRKWALYILYEWPPKFLK